MENRVGCWDFVRWERGSDITRARRFFSLLSLLTLCLRFSRVGCWVGLVLPYFFDDT